MGMIARLLLLFSFFATGQLIRAQEVRTINGRKFTIHVAQQGQTLYAIARSYAVPVDALVSSNPATQDGLSVGEEVLIPMDAVIKKERKTAPVLRSDGELLHTVRKKETLFGIARAYGLDMNAVLERNPEATALREGMELVIPTTKVTGTTPAALLPAVPDEAVQHLVQPGETLFSLGQRYGVKPEAIQRANAGLTAGLKAGGTIRIPRPAAGDPGLPVAVPTFSRTEKYKVGLMLPFAVDRNDSALASTQADDAPTFYEPTRIAAQFLHGALMAIDSLKSCGLHADVEVFDMGDDIKNWNAVIKRPEIQDFDLFIGPFHRTAIEQLARVNSHAHIVCPVPQSNKVILGMPNVSKVTPTRSDLVKFSARYVAQKHATDNMLLACPDIASEKEIQEQARLAMNEALATRAGRYRDTVLVTRPGRRDVSALTGKLDASRLNVVISTSEDVEFVTALVGKLKALSTKYRIQLVGMQSWSDMGSVAVTDLDELGFTYAAPDFVDLVDPRTRSFTERFRAAYKTDVDEYALLGFDVTFYYLKALMTHGRDLASHFAEVRTEPLHMGFHLSRTGPENGYRNECGFMLQQKDLQLIKAP